MFNVMVDKKLHSRNKTPRKSLQVFCWQE